METWRVGDIVLTRSFGAGEVTHVFGQGGYTTLAVKFRAQGTKILDPQVAKLQLIGTWSSRWIAIPVAYLFPADRREEWLGDLREVNRELLQQGYPRWLLNIITIGRTGILVMSAIQIKISDVFSIYQRKSD